MQQQHQQPQQPTVVSPTVVSPTSPAATEASMKSPEVTSPEFLNYYMDASTGAVGNPHADKRRTIAANPSSSTTAIADAGSVGTGQQLTPWLEFLVKNREKASSADNLTATTTPGHPSSNGGGSSSSNGSSNGSSTINSHNKPMASSSHPRLGPSSRRNVVSMSVMDRDMDQLKRTLDAQISNLDRAVDPSIRASNDLVHSNTTSTNPSTSRAPPHSNTNNSTALVGVKAPGWNVKIYEYVPPDLGKSSNDYKTLFVHPEASVLEVLVNAMRKWRCLDPNLMAEVHSQGPRLKISDRVKSQVMAEGWQLVMVQLNERGECRALNDPLPVDSPIADILRSAPPDTQPQFTFRKLTQKTAIPSHQAPSPNTNSTTSTTTTTTTDYPKSSLFEPCYLYKLSSAYPPSLLQEAAPEVDIKHWARRYVTLARHRYLLFFRTQHHARWAQNVLHEIDFARVKSVELASVWMCEDDVPVSELTVCVKTRTRSIYLCADSEDERQRVVRQLDDLRKSLVHSRTATKQLHSSGIPPPPPPLTSIRITDADQRHPSTSSIHSIETQTPPLLRVLARLEQSKRLNDVDLPPYDFKGDPETSLTWAVETNQHAASLVRNYAQARLLALAEHIQHSPTPTASTSSSMGAVSGSDVEDLIRCVNETTHPAESAMGHSGSAKGERSVVSTMKRFWKWGDKDKNGGVSASGSSTQLTMDSLAASGLSGSGLLYYGGGGSTGMSMGAPGSSPSGGSILGGSLGMGGGGGGGGGDLPSKSTVFGVPLEEISARYDTSGFGGSLPIIPPLIRLSIEYLMEKGLHVGGIFRIAGSVKRIEALRRAWEKMDQEYVSSSAASAASGSMGAGGGGVGERSSGPELDFSPYNVHDVAAVLKQFLRDLPDPLLSFKLYRAFLVTAKLADRPGDQVKMVKYLVMMLPPCHRHLLETLLKFLNAIVQNSEDRVVSSTSTSNLTAGAGAGSGGGGGGSGGQGVNGGGEVQIQKGNLMNSSNLAVVVGPNILRDNEQQIQALMAGGAGSRKDSANRLSFSHKRDSFPTTDSPVSPFASSTPGLVSGATAASTLLEGMSEDKRQELSESSMVVSVVKMLIEKWEEVFRIDEEAVGELRQMARLPARFSVNRVTSPRGHGSGVGSSGSSSRR